MPSYYNPYNYFYPASYQSGMGQNAYMPYVNQQMPMQQSGQTQIESMKWVEGEVGAKAFQMPAGWPANTPIPLWDSSDTVIYLKSWSPMGIPNPMQKLHYTIEEQPNPALLTQGQSGASSAENTQEAIHMPDMSQYVTKNELEQMKEDLQKAMNTAYGNSSSGSAYSNSSSGSAYSNSSSGNQNGSNRGGNRNG